MSDLLRVKGLADLQATLTKLPARLQEKSLVHATSNGAAVMQREMIARAPVRDDGRLKKLSKGSTQARLPGFLKASIGRRRADKGSGSSVTYQVGVLGRAFYAIFFEFGTRHQPARPFIRPAVEATSNAAVDAMGDTLRRDIDSAAPGLGLKA